MIICELSRIGGTSALISLKSLVHNLNFIDF